MVILKSTYIGGKVIKEGLKSNFRSVKMKKKTHNNRDVMKALTMISQIGISMLVPIVLCFFFGRWLDDKFGTGFWMIVMTILGVLTAYRNLFALTKPLLKGERERENEAYRRQSEGMDSKKQSDDD